MIRFDPDSHTYWLGSVRVPSVTQILGVITDFSMVDPEVLAYKAQLGTAVHLATELYDAGTLDPASIDPVVEPYLDAWVRFLSETGFEVDAIEQRVFHPAHIYAGTLDRTGRLDGRTAVLDIKTSAALMPSVGPQLAAYQEALAAGEQKTRPERRLAVQLKPDGTYRLKEYSDPADWAAFLSIKTLMSWADKHSVKVKYEPQHRGA